jgi:hypothetical protein
MDPPDGQIDPQVVEGISPGQDVLVDAVDECPVEVEQEGLRSIHADMLRA